MTGVFGGQSVSFVNARVVTPGPVVSSIRFASRVLSVGTAPARGDVVIDLDGAVVLPGLVNGHDHLELNHYGRVGDLGPYRNASEWIDEIRPRLRTDPVILAGRAHPLASRLFIGELKNLLSGATTVVHHNPRYAELNGTYPVRILRRYGWAHSFALERAPAGARGEAGGDVRERYCRTPPDVPFVLHLAEGVDRAASAELERLDHLGCLGDNSVLVHGVAVDPSGWQRILDRGASLVWCPVSNGFLFGQTIPARAFLDASADAWRHLTIGTDSRLTGSRDLLDELRAAAGIGAARPAELLRMVTTAAAHIFGLPDAGVLAPGVSADLLVVPPIADDPAEALLHATRRDVALVAIGGRPMIAAPGFSSVFRARRVASRPIRLDGVEKLGDARLVRAIDRCPIAEPGLEVAA